LDGQVEVTAKVLTEIISIIQMDKIAVVGWCLA
jgi:hypothetical protein